MRVRISPGRVFFSASYYLLLISKDGCEKGRDPKVLDINALVGVQEFT